MSTEHSEENIQRALNEAKKRKLEERYGGSFSSTGPDLPPEIEAEWLESIEEFEEKFERAGQITVRSYIGAPLLSPVAELPAEVVQEELDKLLDLLRTNNIEVEFPASIGPEEAYRFLVEELLNEEMDDIRIEGMTQYFLYEEFHPDSSKDASMYAEMFLRDVFNQDSDETPFPLSDEELYGMDGAPITRAEMKEEINRFRRKFAVFLGITIGAPECILDGEYATVRTQVSWGGLKAGSMEKVNTAGEAMVRLRHAGEGWDVIQLSVPGWECS